MSRAFSLDELFLLYVMNWTVTWERVKVRNTAEPQQHDTDTRRIQISQVRGRRSCWWARPDVWWWTWSWSPSVQAGLPSHSAHTSRCPSWPEQTTGRTCPLSTSSGTTVQPGLKVNSSFIFLITLVFKTKQKQVIIFSFKRKLNKCETGSKWIISCYY